MATAERRTLSIEARLKDNLTKPIGTMERALTRFALSNVQGMKRLVGSVVSLRGAVTGLVGAYVGLQGINLVRKFGDEADALVKLARSSGDSVENLSELEAAFRLNGANGDAFTGTLRALTTAARGALQGNLQLVRSFTDLGISLQDLQTLSPSQILEKAASGLEEFNGEQQKALALSRLLPEQYQKLLPLLGDGVAKFQRDIQTVRNAGATITNEQARVAEALNDAFLKVEIAIGSVGRSLIEAFGPRTAALLERLAKNIAENRDEIVGIAETIGRGIVASVNLAIDAIIGLIGAIESIPGISLIKEDELRAQTREIERQLRIIEARKEFLATGKENLQSAGGNFVGATAAGDIISALGPGFQRITPAIEADQLLPKEEDLRKQLQAIQTTISKGLSGALKDVRAQLAEELNAATAAIGAPSTPEAAAGALGLPSPDQVGQYAAQVAQVMKGAAGSIQSVFRSSKEGAQDLGEGLDFIATKERERLQLLQQLGAFAADLIPVQDALAGIDQQLASLPFREAFERGVISAEELAQAVQFLNAQFERQRALLAELGPLATLDGGTQQLLGDLAELVPSLENVRNELLELDRVAKEQQLRKAFDAGVISAKQLADAIEYLKTKTDEAKGKSQELENSFTTGWERAFGGIKNQATNLATTAGEALGSIVGTGLDGLSTAFADVVTGTKDAEDAFKDFAIAFLRDVAKMAAQLLILGTLKIAFGLEDGGVVDNGAQRNLPMRKFARGGIAREPTLALFGEGHNAEAFVPLPDNRSIPVSFVGGGPGGGAQVMNINIQAMDSRDVSRALQENQQALRRIWQNQVETRTGVRQTIQRAAY